MKTWTKGLQRIMNYCWMGLAALSFCLLGQTASARFLDACVWLDLNCDGIRQGGEPAVGDVTVTAYYCQNNQIPLLNDNTTPAILKTEAGGCVRFAFASPPPGVDSAVYLIFTAPNGATFTAQNIGPDTTDSDVDATGKSACTVVEGLQANPPRVDAGLCEEPPPAGGCTRTQGYWKTHSEFGPAPYDSTWASLPNGASTAFYLSGKTYIAVFGTPPAGNAYYNLAHQYIAAQLNQIAGAAIPAGALAAYNDATTLLQTYTPAQIGALRGNNALRKSFINLGGVLGAYNEGKLGVAHCD
jgi:hypothetical protein